MTDREKIIKSLKNALNSLDYTSDLRLVLIRTIEYLQEEPHKELYDKLSKLTEDALAKETKESWNEFLDNEPVSEDLLSIHPCKVCKIGVKSTGDTVSEDLDEAADDYARRNPAYAVDKWGNWSACNREKPKYDFKAGARWQKQRLMQDAVERVVKIDAGGYPYIDATELYDYDNDKPLAKAGDNVRIIFIKEG